MKSTIEKLQIPDNLIWQALLEDIGSKGDITTDSIFTNDQSLSFVLILNEDAVLSGLDVLKKVYFLLDKNIVVKSDLKDGDQLEKFTTIANIYGSVKNILKGERTALNFLSHMSGIATLTHQLVEQIKHTGAILLDTRKTTPNLRFFEKQAVAAGGGKNHRFNLSEMILIKDNHISAAGSIKSAMEKVRKHTSPDTKIEIEVESTEELQEAIACKPDVIMFDNWSVEDLRNVVKLLPEYILSEASGQINLGNIKNYAETGVHYISTSYMIKNSKWVDFSLEVRQHEI